MANNHRIYAKGIALAIIVGALPFLLCAHAYASEQADSVPAQGARKWLDDYKQPVGFTYSLQATLNTTYIWRGLYVGGLNIQPEASVGYGGAYVSVWGNIGATTWTFAGFLPEIDISVGFARWGLNASVTYIHLFNRPFFDFSNRPDGGNTLEVGVRYTVSSKLPLSVYWATRVAASDGYLNEAGDTIRPYSTYIELSYTHHFPYDISLRGAVGITPWRSLYTGYQRGFAVQNIEVRLAKEWSLSTHCGMKLQGVLSVNPSALAADRDSGKWLPDTPENQSVNANIGVSVYWK